MRNDPFLKSVGAKIAAIRKAKKINQKELAAMCNLSHNGICLVETGRQAAQLMTLKKIADVLEVDVKDFL